MDFVGSPEMLAMFVEFQIPLHLSYVNPIFKLNYSSERNRRNKTNLRFIRQRN